MPTHDDIRTEALDHDQTPLGRLELRRFTAGDEIGYEILIDGSFLMASHGSHSERHMAHCAFDRLRGPERPLTALVGGLGAGHTLRATLDLPHVERVVVAEIGAKVVEWNRRYFGEFNRQAVDDPRTEIVIDDVADVVRRSPSAFDLVLLDVDNGPGWLAADGNAGLYDRAGLEACRRCLKPGGVLAVWSPQANPEFEQSLSSVFGAWEAVDTSAIGRAEGEPGSVIYCITTQATAMDP
jgi:spermidine synthase